MSRLKTLAELVRLPNVFSAAADILLGFFLAAAFASEINWVALPFALAASVCLYWSGMVLNDFFDAEIDAEQRPNRPIPSGRIKLRTVWGFGFSLLLAGVALAWLLTPWLGSARPGLIALCVAASVLAYDGGLKRTPLGPVAMGACRFFNVLLGASLIATRSLPWFPAAVWCAAAGIGTYIVGVTLFARTEAVISARSHLILAVGIMLVGLGLIAAVPLTPGFPQDVPVYWWIANAAMILFISWRVWPAIRNPAPNIVQPTIGRLLRLLILLDALALCAANLYVALGMLLLVPCAWIAGRWAYST